MSLDSIYFNKTITKRFYNTKHYVHQPQEKKGVVKEGRKKTQLVDYFKLFATTYPSEHHFGEK